MHQAIEPLKTLESVLSWQPLPEYELSRGSVALSNVYRRDKKASKTLVCHDMKGGYIEDRFVEGCADIGYRFYHWQYLDTFVYFSHHLVTIPPPGWTNSAHRHGVKMLGTFITEWDDGKATCSQFLQTSRDFRGLVNKMVDIMKYYRFDGWLINIENVIEENKVNNLKEFVAYLTTRCHSEIEGSEVLWYDSVTKTGELNWQDQLNGENRMFFDVCDGIFLNYCWDEKKLQDSYTQAVEQGRVHDVFVGVDVFGRGCPGGGGYNSCEALSMIRKADLSTAIFAPGWVYETQEDDFTANQDRFWRLLHEYCATSVLTHPCLSTSFCHGFGKKYFCKGEVVSDKPWYNISMQQIQPSLNMQGQRSEFKRVTFTENDGYLGGGCLLLEGQFINGKETLDFNLFQMDAPVSTDLYVAYTFKDPKKVGLESVIKLTLSKSGQSRVLCLGHPKEEEEGQTVKKAKTDMEEMWIDVSVKESSLFTWQNVNEWETRCFHISEGLMSGRCLQSVSVDLTASHAQQDKDATFFIGQLQILPTSPSILPGVENLSCSHLVLNTENSGSKIPTGEAIALDLSRRGDNSRATLTYLLQWEDKQANNVQYYNVYHTFPDQVPELVRQSVIQTCTVSLDRKKNNGNLTVQTVSLQGSVLPIEDCPSCSIPK